MNTKYKKAFTLMELLIYLGIFAGVSVAVVSTLVMVTRTKPQVDVKAEVQNNVQRVMETINQKIGNVAVIYNAESGLLKFTPINATTTTIFTLSGGTLYLKEADAATTTLTSDKVSVDTLVFNQVIQPPAPRSISVALTMSYRAGGNPLLTFSSTLQQLFPVAKAVTFDSGVFPSTGGLDIGASSLRWASGYYSGNVSITGNLGVYGGGVTYPLQVGTNSLVVTSGGNVGIGIAGPTYKLDIQGGQINASGGMCIAGSCIISWPTGGGGGDTWGIISTGIYNATSTDTVIVGASSIANAANSLEVTGLSYFSSNVGIGTGGSAPSAKLHVVGSALITANLDMGNSNITGVNKITVTTIDPLYDIKGKKYSTYAASVAGGVKEEYVGKAKLSRISNFQFPISNYYEYVIDFDEVENGSDLWLWRQVVDFSRDNVEVLATPYGQPAGIYYEIEGNKIVFRGDQPAEFSFRLIGKRFDWQNWPTLSKDQNEKPSLIVK